MFYRSARALNCIRRLRTVENNTIKAISASYTLNYRKFSEAAEVTLETSPKVLNIVDQITTLNLREVSELVSELKSQLNLPEQSFMPAMGMPMGGVAAAAPVEAEEEVVEEIKPIVDIKLESFDEANKIKIIKEVKTLTGLGLKEAKDLVVDVPSIILKDKKREEAEEILKKFEELGCKAVLE